MEQRENEKKPNLIGRIMRSKTFIKIVSVVVIMLVGFLAMTVLSSTEKHSNKRELEEEVRMVETENIEFTDLTLEISGNGVIESKRTLDVIAEARGKLIYAKNDLKSGTFVKKGELIAEIDPRETENELYSLRSDFMNSVASILPDFKIENEAVYNKWMTYFNKIDIHSEVPNLPEFTTQQEKLKISAKGIMNKYYNVRNKEILLSKHSIYAPFSGYVESNGIIENSYVNVGQQLVTLSDAVNLEIAVPLLAEEVNLININGSPKVKIYSEKSDEFIQGRVIRRETNLQRNSQTMNVYVSLTNGNLNTYYLPGNYVNLAIEGRKFNDVAVVPRGLLDNDNNIFVMEEGRLQKLKVEVITIQNDMAVIRNTIPENTVLVTTILQKPLVGMRIESINHPADSLSKANKETENTPITVDSESDQ